jgi:hypothetical protein
MLDRLEYMMDRLGYIFAFAGLLVMLLLLTNSVRSGMKKYIDYDDYINELSKEDRRMEPFMSSGTLVQMTAGHTPNANTIDEWEDEKRLVERELVSMTGSSLSAPTGPIDPLGLHNLPTQKAMA